MGEYFILKRGFCFFTLLFFVLTNHIGILPSAYAAPPVPSSTSRFDPTQKFPENPGEVKVPAEIGKIREIFSGTNRKTVILLQDAHGVPDAQQNIRRLIEYFQERYGLGLVALEGSAARLDPQIFRSFPDKKRLKKVFEDYLAAGELSGASVAAVLSDREGHYAGIEDWTLYEEGLRFFLKAMARKDKILKQLDRFKDGLEKDKEKNYSPGLLALDRGLQKFQANQANFLETLGSLAESKAPPEGSDLALLVREGREVKTDRLRMEATLQKYSTQVKSLIQSKAFPEISKKELQIFNQMSQDFQTSKIPPEAFAFFLKTFIEKNQLPVKMDPEAEEIAKRQEKMRDIEGTQLLRDFERYAGSVKESLFRNEEERKLDRRSAGLSLLRRLTLLEIRREDWQIIKTRNLPEITKDFSRRGVRDPFVRRFFWHLAFYQNSEKRDKVFIDRLTGLMNANDQGTSLLLTGGFHREGLTERLKKEGYSYILLLPAIRSIPENTAYQDSMRGNVPWKNYFKVEDGQVDLYKAFVRATRDSLLEEEKGDAGKLLRSWREEILRDLSKKKEISKANQYLPFIDEILEKASIDALRQKWLANIDRFIGGLKQLKTQGQLTEQKILGLFQAASMMATHNLGINPDRLPAALAVSRGEIRTEDDLSEQPEDEDDERIDWDLVQAMAGGQISGEMPAKKIEEDEAKAAGRMNAQVQALRGQIHDLPQVYAGAAMHYQTLRALFGKREKTDPFQKFLSTELTQMGRFLDIYHRRFAIKPGPEPEPESMMGQYRKAIEDYQTVPPAERQAVWERLLKIYTEVLKTYLDFVTRYELLATRFLGKMMAYKDDPDFPEFSEVLQSLQKSIQKQYAVIDNAENELHESLPLERVDLRKVLAERRIFFQGLPASRGAPDQVRVQILVPPGTADAPAMINETAFVRVIANLVNNAVDAILKQSGTGQIQIRLEADDRWCRIYVENTGSRIPDEILESGRLFELGVTSSGQPDRGVGLSVVKKYVEQEWSGILESPKNLPGAVQFSFQLPLVRPEMRGEILIPWKKIKSMPAFELLKALEFQKARLLKEEDRLFDGRTIRIRTVEIPEDAEGGIRILNSELANVMDSAERHFLVNRFDLLFDENGYLIVVSPLPDQALLQKADLRLFHYFDFTDYYFKVPQPGALSDEKAVAKWTGLALQEKKNRAVVERYREETFGYSGEKITRYAEMPGSMGIPAEIQHPFVRVRLNEKTGEIDFEQFFPGQYKAELLNQRVPGSKQIIIPIFPTVYSPGVYRHYGPDQIYYQSIYVPAGEVGTKNDFLDLRPQDKVLVPFAGSGIDTWLVYQAMLRRWRLDPAQDHSQKPKFDIFASDGNPLAVASVLNFAHTAGFEVTVRVFDNIVSKSGEPVFPVPFTRVAGNMPSYTPETAGFQKIKVPSQATQWDKEEGGVLHRYAEGLRSILDRAADPRVLIWNSPYFETLEVPIPKDRAAELDRLPKILRSGGEYRPVEGIQGPALFHVEPVYDWAHYEAGNSLPAVYRIKPLISGEQPVSERSELRRTEDFANQVVTPVAEALMPGRKGMHRDELQGAVRIIAGGRVPLDQFQTALMDRANKDENLTMLITRNEARKIDLAVVDAEIERLKNQILTPEKLTEHPDQKYTVGISLPAAQNRDFNDFMEEIIRKDPNLGHLLAVGSGKIPSAWMEDLKRRNIFPRSVSESDLRRGIILPDEEQPGVPVAMAENQHLEMHEEFLSVLFEAEGIEDSSVASYGNQLKAAVVIHLARILKTAPDKTLRKQPEELKKELLKILNQFEGFQSPLNWVSQNGQLSFRISAKAVKEYLAARSFGVSA